MNTVYVSPHRVAQREVNSILLLGLEVVELKQQPPPPPGSGHVTRKREKPPSRRPRASCLPTKTVDLTNMLKSVTLCPPWQNKYTKKPKYYA